MSNNNPYERNTSFTKSPGIPQLASYVVFLTQTILYYAVVLPRLQGPTAQALLGTFYSLSLLALVVSALVSSLTDPADTAMVHYRNQRDTFQDWRKEFAGKLLYCDYCRSYVKEKSRHCRSCDRCVENFDHHCMWINNCIGIVNYKAFVAMIVSACVHLALYVATLAALTAQGTFPSFLPAFIISWLSGAVNAVFVFLLLNLIVLHLYLLYKGLSTYEFIVAQRQEQKRRKEEEQNKKLGSESHKVVIPEQSLPQPLPNDTNSNEGLPDKRKSQKVQLQEDHSRSSEKPKMIRVESRSSVHHQHEQMIFGEREMTEKSGIGKREGDRQGEQEIEDSGSDSSSVVLSQLFTRNKSLKLIIGTNDFFRPHKPLAGSPQPRPKKAHSMFQ